jgi:hypothetical protein
MFIGTFVKSFEPFVFYLEEFKHKVTQRILQRNRKGKKYVMTFSTLLF